MICPNCGWDNLPGNEECGNCHHDLTALDRPSASDRVEKSLMEDEVTLLDPKSPVIASPELPIRDALQIMLEKEVGTLLITDASGQLVGIFSERDILNKMTDDPESFLSLPISSMMTPRAECVAPNDTLAFALHKMDVGGYRHLPVINAAKPVGVISVRDMLEHITKLCADQ